MKKTTDFVKKYKIILAVSLFGVSIYKRESIGNVFFFFYHSSKAKSFAKKKQYQEALEEYDLIINKNPATHFEKGFN